VASNVVTIDDATVPAPRPRARRTGVDVDSPTLGATSLPLRIPLPLAAAPRLDLAHRGEALKETRVTPTGSGFGVDTPVGGRAVRRRARVRVLGDTRDVPRHGRRPGRDPGRHAAQRQRLATLDDAIA
jgi:hypothetical protein